MRVSKSELENFVEYVNSQLLELRSKVQIHISYYSERVHIEQYKTDGSKDDKGNYIYGCYSNMYAGTKTECWYYVKAIQQGLTFVTYRTDIF